MPRLRPREPARLELLRPVRRSRLRRRPAPSGAEIARSQLAGYGLSPPSRRAAATSEPPPHQSRGRPLRDQRYLGEGGRKRVYLAHDTLLDRDVAVGLVKTSGLDEDARVRVTREAQSMARLGDHPHVVTVHDIGEEDGDPYIVSQYMAGGSLDELLESAADRRLDLDTTLEIAEGSRERSSTPTSAASCTAT